MVNSVEYFSKKVDVIVIGAGHAGIEAGLASARLGMSTAIFTMNMDAVGNLPCNPSIGGTAKGHLVREIDALGGEMGKTADKCFIQSRMLNRGKGPAVHSLRVQVDRREYSSVMKKIIEQQENLEVRQTEIVEIRKSDEGWQAVTHLHAVFDCKKIIIASGTFLRSTIHVGDVSYSGGPDSMFGAQSLTQSLENLGISLRRFKTGTPARVNRASIDFSKLEVQNGDEQITPFSFETTGEKENKEVCHITWTNEKTKDVILKNLHRSPLYSGAIEGVGPRYCPSIEDKIVRFKDKERHQVFIEPCGLNTNEMYLQGVSSSLPEDVQIALYKTIGGLENVQIMRNAYAIEYDCCDPTQLLPTLEFKKLKGLYGAGQFNGSSGYEEAAAQGLVAGINAALNIAKKQPLILDRAGSYIGTLIDDLVTKGVSDPYRMMTSRSEYRLILRQDNADLRLTDIGYSVGLISEERYSAFKEKRQKIEREMERIKKISIAPSKELNNMLVSRGTSEMSAGGKLISLLKRPEIGYKELTDFDTQRPSLPREVFEQVEIEVKYEGYIKRQLSQIDEMRRVELKALSPDIDYNEVSGLRLEAAEKLNKIKPLNLGQASRISGVSPADISILMLYIAKLSGENK